MLALANISCVDLLTFSNSLHLLSLRVYSPTSTSITCLCPSCLSCFRSVISTPGRAVVPSVHNCGHRRKSTKIDGGISCESRTSMTCCRATHSVYTCLTLYGWFSMSLTVYLEQTRCNNVEFTQYVNPSTFT